jgi:hypothetical protein
MILPEANNERLIVTKAVNRTFDFDEMYLGFVSEEGKKRVNITFSIFFTFQLSSNLVKLFLNIALNF